VDFGKLGLGLVMRYGNNHEKWYGYYVMSMLSILSAPSRAVVLFTAFGSGYDSVHLRVCLKRLEDAIKWGHASGDRLASVLELIHLGDSLLA
jgi:hypothetical protein